MLQTVNKRFLNGKWFLKQLPDEDWDVGLV